MNNNQFFNHLLHLTGCGRYDELVVEVFKLGGNPDVSSSMIKGWKTDNEKRGTFLPDDVLEEFIGGLHQYRNKMATEEGIDLFYSQLQHQRRKKAPGKKPAGKSRRHNKTGIKGLSIGKTKNTMGYTMQRYAVNYKSEAGKPKSKSFYFGERCSQKDAFDKACTFMLNENILPDGIDEGEIYKEFKHEQLL